MAEDVAAAMKQSGLSPGPSSSGDVGHRLKVFGALLSRLEQGFERSLGDREVEWIESALFSRNPDQLYRVVQSISRGREIFTRAEITEFQTELDRAPVGGPPPKVPSHLDRELERCLDLGQRVLDRELHGDEIDALVEGHLFGVNGDLKRMWNRFEKQFGPEDAKRLIKAGLGRRRLN